MGVDKSLARPGRKQATATEDFDVHAPYLFKKIGGILVLFVYITRLASNEIFPPSNKIHREVGRAKDLSAPCTTDSELQLLESDRPQPVFSPAAACSCLCARKDTERIFIYV